MSQIIPSKKQKGPWGTEESGGGGKGGEAMARGDSCLARIGAGVAIGGAVGGAVGNLLPPYLKP